MNAYDYLLDDLFYSLQSDCNYEFSHVSSEQQDLYRIAERQDEKTKDLIHDIMEQWQRYGFANGFAYAVRLFMEC